MSTDLERRSFRADTLEEALRLVSDELGPDALVVRQREGVIGGVGGFFGRHCVELEVELPAGPASVSEAVSAARSQRPRSLAIPRGAVIDRYDSAPSVSEVSFAPFASGDSPDPGWLEPEAPAGVAEPEPSSFDWIEPQPEPRSALPAEPAVEAPEASGAPEPPPAPVVLDEPAAVPEEPVAPAVVEAPVPVETAAAAVEPAAPIVVEAPAVSRIPEKPAAAEEPVAPETALVPAAPAVAEVAEIAPEQPAIADEEPEDAGALVQTLFDQAAPFADKLSETLERTSIGRRLADAGMNSRVAREVVAEAETELRVFDPLQPFEEQVRTALARRIKVSRVVRKKRRVIALVGPPGAGKTLTTARLCHVYGGDAKRPVAALSLQPVREAFRLAEHTRSLDVQLAAADEVRVLEVELEKLVGAELLIVDTPGVEPGDDDRLRALAGLLELVGADETHLLVPAALDAPRVRELVEAFSSTLGANRIMITHLDGPGDATAAVSASIDSRLPISFTATGASWGLRPADPHQLAELVVR